MIKKKIRKTAVKRRHKGIRVKIQGTTERPRLAVHRTNLHIYAQIIDDVNGVTVASASTVEKDLRDKFSNCGNIEAAKVVGQLVAERAKKANVENVVFDRGGFVYHGRVSALADAAREAGLQF